MNVADLEQAQTKSVYPKKKSAAEVDGTKLTEWSLSSILEYNSSFYPDGTSIGRFDFLGYMSRTAAENRNLPRKELIIFLLSETIVGLNNLVDLIQNKKINLPQRIELSTSNITLYNLFKTSMGMIESRPGLYSAKIDITSEKDVLEKIDEVKSSINMAIQKIHPTSH